MPLTDLYDPLTMPPDLLKAHQALDKAVMRLYGFLVKDFTEADCVVWLMGLYEGMMEKGDFMMKKILQPLFGLLILAFFGFVGVTVLRYIGGLAVGGLERLVSLDAVIVVALITGALSFSGVIISRIIEYRQQTKRYLFQQRAPSYTQFISLLTRMAEDSKKVKKKEITEEEMMQELVKELHEISTNIMLWGSTRVVKKWLAFRRASLNPDGGHAVLFTMEAIVFEMRKDMGHSRRNLKSGDMLRFLINDFDEAIANAAVHAEKRLEKGEAIIGELIKARQERNISQRELEQLSGVKQPIISRMEAGETSPQLDTVLRVLAPLGKTLYVGDLEER